MSRYHGSPIAVGIGDEQAGYEDAIQCSHAGSPTTSVPLHPKALTWVTVVKNLGMNLLATYKKAENELLLTLLET
jgi:hypothetical protein